MTGAGDDRLAEQLTSLGRLLGITVVVTDESEWIIAPESVRVGLGFYRDRGIAEGDVMALALRDFWVGVRLPLLEPGRAYRREAIEAAQPELAPLLATADRLDAMAAIEVALPGIASDLRQATARSIADDVSELSLEAQWLAAVTRSFSGAALPVVAPQVRRQLGGFAMLLERAAHCGPLHDACNALAFREASAPTGVDRLDRVLALIAPPYLELLRGAGQGLATPGASLHARPADGDDEGLGGDEGRGPRSGESDDGTDAEAQGSGASQVQALDTAAPQDAEGGDEPSVDERLLVESQSAVAPTAFLETPLSATRASLAPLDVPGDESRPLSEADHERVARDDPRGPRLAPAPHPGVQRAAVAEYRARLERYRREVTATREVWRLAVSEQLRLRQIGLQRGAVEGAELFRERLAATVTEVAAGVPRPAAYQQYERRPRHGDGLRSTDYVLLLDRSGSMQGAAAELCADAAMVMVESLAAVSRDLQGRDERAARALDVRLRAGIIAFGDEPVVVKGLDTPVDDEVRASLHAAVRGARGSTRGAAALDAAAALFGPEAQGERPRRVVLCVTDGDLDDVASLKGAIAGLDALGAEVHAIGVGRSPGIEVFAPAFERIDTLRELPGLLARVVAADAQATLAGRMPT
ncbi:vWA domain-containing protein [Leucobacter chinensis]|uniref:vWA domain-containing protein n=1 Tax=Leucobacter chinensis TaxID=2851010 RepID=UPI001C244273|nr:vWA domain-containing protein [Leucobacter chinensis]